MRCLVVALLEMVNYEEDLVRVKVRVRVRVKLGLGLG